MNVEKSKAKLPTLTNEELDTLAAMVADEQKKRKVTSRVFDYTLHRNKRQFVPKVAKVAIDNVTKWIKEKQKEECTPEFAASRNDVVREFRNRREGIEPPFLSPEHFEQIFNKHHPGGSMMEDDFCGIDENEY